MTRQIAPQVVSDAEWQVARIEGRWVPVSLAAAEWAARKLVDAHSELGEIAAEVEEYAAQVMAWASEQMSSGRAAELVRSIEVLETALTRYALDRRAESDGKVKTVKLPTVELRTTKARERKPKFKVIDTDAIVAWAEKDAPETIRKSVDLKLLKLLVVRDGDGQEHVITADGEPVPGVEHEWDDTEREPTVTIAFTDGVIR